MAENVPAEGFAALQVGQTRVLRKRAHANNGVVSPIIAFGAMPPGNACSYQRAVQPPRKLLQSSEQRLCVDNNGQRLDQSDAWMRLHRGRQPDDGVARHQAVGIQDDHMVVAAAEPLDPVLDIA